MVRWHELLAIAAVALMMILCAIVLSLGNTGFKASIAVSRRRVTVGDDVHVTVDIDNPGRTPTTTARGDLPLGEAHERFGIPMLAPGQSKQTDIEFTTVSRAVLTVGPLNIRKGDPFGLVRHEKALAERITVYIHPNIVRLNTLNAGVARDLEGQPSGQIVDDDLDFYGLREYEPGDDVRNAADRHEYDARREPAGLRQSRGVRDGRERARLAGRAVPQTGPSAADACRQRA